jgi:hypothetical protein
MRLCDRYPIENGVQATIAATVQAVTRSVRGRRFQWGDTGVSRELCVSREAPAGTEHSRDCSRREEVHATQTGERQKPVGDEGANAVRHFVGLVLRKLKANRQPADRTGAFQPE